MNTCTLVTGYDDQMSSIGDLTCPIMEEYANYHDFSFTCVKQYHSRMHPSFQKVEAVLDAFKQSDTVIWMDADVIVTNKKIDPFYQFSFAEPGLNMSRDVWPLSVPDTFNFTAGVMVSTREAIPVFEWLLTQEHRFFSPPWEQAALRDGMQHEWIRSLVHVHDRRVMNSLPFNEHVPEPWQPGDWVCHLSGLSNDVRVEQFKRYKTQGNFHVPGVYAKAIILS